MTPFQIRLVAAGAVLCLLAAPYVLNPFSITLLNYIGIYSLVAIGLALLTGIGGIVSFGQAAFVGVAAYATAWTSALNGYSPWLGLALAITLTCAVAAILGFVTLRGNIDGLCNFKGISAIPPISIGAFALVESAQIY